MIQKYRNEFTVAAMAFAVMLLCYLQAVTNFNYSLDAYGICSYVGDDWRHSFFQNYMENGRFGRAYLYLLFESFGVFDCNSGFAISILSIGLIASIPVALARMTGVKNGIGLFALSCAFIHPYFAETFAYREGMIYYALALVMATASAYATIHQASRRWLVFAVISLALSLSLYQLSLNLYAIIVLLVLFSVATGSVAAEGLAKKFIVRSACVAAIATVCYLGASKWFIAFSGSHANSRMAFIEPGALLDQIVKVCGFIFHMAFKEEPFYPYPLKISFALSLLVFFVVVAAGILQREESLGKRILKIGLAVLIVILMIFSVVGVQLPLKEFSPSRRTISLLMLIYVTVFALASRWFDKYRKTAVVLGLAFCFQIFFLIGNTNRILTDQYRVNLRDMAKANRIFASLESQPNYQDMQKLVVLGGNWEYAAGISTGGYGINDSAYASDWSKTEIIQEISGHKFKYLSPEDHKIGDGYCKSATPWPDRDAITIKLDLGIVCLGAHPNGAYKKGGEAR